MLGQGKPRTGRPKSGSYREGRSRKLCIRISESDLHKLSAICEFLGITKSDFIIKSINDKALEVKKYGHSIRRSADYSSKRS